MPLLTVYDITVQGLQTPEGKRNLRARRLDPRPDSLELRAEILARLAQDLGLKKLPKRTEIAFAAAIPADTASPLFQPYTHLIKPLPPHRLTIRITCKTPAQRDQVAAFDLALEALFAQTPNLGIYDDYDTDGTRMTLLCYTANRPALRAAIISLQEHHPLPPFRFTPPGD
jgi:hypothetical protein